MYASWPAHTKCSVCGAKLRIKSSPWFNMLIQLTAPLLLVLGVVVGLDEYYMLGALLIVLGLGSFAVYIFMGKLEVVG